MISVTKLFKFEAAHFLPDYDGVCKHIHGHSYRLEVEVSSKFRDDLGMIMDFKVLKEMVNRLIIDKFDHTLINSLEIFPFHENPTAENMVSWFAFILIQETIKLRQQEPDKYDFLSLERVRLWETDTCYAEWKELKWMN